MVSLLLPREFYSFIKAYEITGGMLHKPACHVNCILYKFFKLECQGKNACVTSCKFYRSGAGDLNHFAQAFLNLRACHKIHFWSVERLFQLIYGGVVVAGIEVILCQMLFGIDRLAVAFIQVR